VRLHGVLHVHMQRWKCRPVPGLTDIDGQVGLFHSQRRMETKRPCRTKTICHPDDYSMSYSKPADQTAAVVAALAELGVRAEDRVLIMLPDGPGFAEAFTGTIEHGAVPLPVNPLLPAHGIAAVAAEAGAQLVLASADRVPALADLAAEPPVLVDGPRGPWAAALRLRLSEEFPSQIEGSSE
jgi:acyl-CoA synthetase (AMP-forming)/AMP-acid ligase II